MPLNTSAFVNGFSTFLQTKSSQEYKQTAEMISSLYLIMISSGTNIFLQNVFPGNSNIITDGFERSFKISETTKSLNFFPAALGIISFWQTTRVNILPPPPGSISGIYNQITFFGNPALLSSQITAAFQSGTPENVAYQLNSAFQTHLNALAGICIALIPSFPSPTPSTFPWAGII